MEGHLVRPLKVVNKDYKITFTSTEDKIKELAQTKFYGCMADWFKSELDDLIEEHYVASNNEHIWAMGCRPDEQELAQQHEDFCEQHHEYIEFLTKLKALME